MCDFEKDSKDVSNLAKLLAVMGVRNNTDLENLHCGVSPRSQTGDYTDVKVISPYGEIKWSNVSRISDEEMRSLMLSIEKALTNTLRAYICLNDGEKESLYKFIATQRSYDIST
jgi:hypothetical protein